MPISAEEANRQLHERLDEQGLERHQMAKKNVQLVEEVSNSLFQAPPVTFMEFVKGAFSPEYFEMVFRIIWPVFTLTLVSIVVWQRWKIIQLLKRLPK